MFGCIPKNALENIFQCLVVFLKILQKTHFLLVAHIFSASKQIYNIISQSTTQKKQNPKKKKIIKSGQIERRRKRERRLGSIQRRDRAAEARLRGGGEITRRWSRSLLDQRGAVIGAVWVVGLELSLFLLTVSFSLSLCASEARSGNG